MTSKEVCSFDGYQYSLAVQVGAPRWTCTEVVHNAIGHGRRVDKRQATSKQLHAAGDLIGGWSKVAKDMDSGGVAVGTVQLMLAENGMIASQKQIVYIRERELRKDVDEVMNWYNESSREHSSFLDADFHAMMAQDARNPSKIVIAKFLRDMDAKGDGVPFVVFKPANTTEWFCLPEECLRVATLPTVTN